MSAQWKTCERHGPATENAWGCPECVREMRTRIAELEQKLAERKWISVKERLPRESDSAWPDGDVLYLVDGKNPETIATWSVGELIEEGLNVTHWMPVPPAGEKD